MNPSQFLAPEGWFHERGGPRYAQLRQRLSDGVVKGILAPGHPLPSEREIASITDFSRVTVRKAIQSLAEDGTIIQRRGSGSFVATKPEQIEHRLSRLTSFSEDMSRRGKVATSRWLDRGLFLPSPDEMTTLGLTSDASVARIARLRLADGAPVAVERASLPTDILPDPLAVGASLYETLERAGHRPVRAIQKISAVNLKSKDAELLAAPAGDAGLHIERTSYLPSGRIAEFTHSIYRGDAYNFVAELRVSRD